MAVVALVKPGLIKGDMVTLDASTSEVGHPGFLSAGDPNGIGGTIHYYLKIVERVEDFYSRLEPVTGSFDEQPCWENNFHLEADVVMRGAMVADQAIGIKNLVLEDTGNLGQAAANPLGGAVTPIIHVFPVGGGGSASGTFATRKERFQFYLALERIRVHTRYDATYTGITITGKMSAMTDALLADIENEV